MPVVGFEDSYVSAKKEIVIQYQGKPVKFFATEIGYLAYQTIAIRAAKQNLNPVALLVAESIETENGEKFTYDEANRLKEEVAKPFIDAVMELNGSGGPEKK